MPIITLEDIRKRRLIALSTRSGNQAAQESNKKDETKSTPKKRKFDHEAVDANNMTKPKIKRYRQVRIDQDYTPPKDESSDDEAPDGRGKRASELKISDAELDSIRGQDGSAPIAVHPVQTDINEREYSVRKFEQKYGGGVRLGEQKDDEDDVPKQERAKEQAKE